MNSPQSPRRWDALKEVARSLSCFAEEKQYTYIDRIGDALSPEIAVKALKDALRALRSMKTAKQSIQLPSMEAVEAVIKMISENIEYANILAALALTGECTPSPGKEDKMGKGEK